MQLQKRITSSASGTIGSLRKLFRSKQSKVGGLILLVIGIIIGVGSIIEPFSPNAYGSNINAPPSYQHPFGTDYVGHDLLSQVIYGAYPSLLVSLVAAVGASLIGVFAGIFAGYYGKLDFLIGGGGDVILTFPSLALMIMIGLILPFSDGLLVFMLIFVLWPTVSRSVRPQVASVKQLPYLEASKMAGVSDLRILWKVIAPTVGAIGFAYFIINVSLAIILTTVLELLGVGNPNIVTWGSILYWAQNYGYVLGDWWWIFFPGAIITIVVIAFALLGFSAEEIFDPRLRR
ncbi:MAG: ABC transporter permease [Thaumarchaeota archaeon]|nr:ABC transporter permease [Nitrososphaerota archaeon]